MKRLTVFCVLLFGVWTSMMAGYDLYNGRKTCHDTNYNGALYLARECTLKNGYLSGDYKAYRENGKLDFAIRPKSGKWVVEIYEDDGTLAAQVSIPSMSVEAIETEKDYIFYGKGFCQWEDYSIEWDGPQNGTTQESWTKKTRLKANRIPVYITSKGYWEGCLMLDINIYAGGGEDYESKQVSFYTDAYSDSQQLLKEYTLTAGNVLSAYTLYEDGQTALSLTSKNDIWTYQEYDDAGQLVSKVAITMPKGQKPTVPCDMMLSGVGFDSKEDIIYMPSEDGEVKVLVEVDEEYSDSIESRTLTTTYGQMPVSMVVIEDDNDCPTLTVALYPEDATYLMQEVEKEYRDGKIYRNTELKYVNDLIHFTVRDHADRLLIQGSFDKDNYLVGEFRAWEYDETDGKLLIENIYHYAHPTEKVDFLSQDLNYIGGHFLYGVRDGESRSVSTKVAGVKTIWQGDYKMGKRMGLHTTKSYINGREQLDESMYYTENGREGFYQAIHGEDSVIFCTYHNDTVEGYARIYHDGRLNYRTPRHICTDTTQLTLVLSSHFHKGELVGLAQMYYPCYYTDYQGKIIGLHAGELYMDIDYDKGVYHSYSSFDEPYDDATYTQQLREIHIDPVTRKLHGLTTFYDANGQIVQQENYVHETIEGWAIYRNVRFCDELKAYYENGDWLKSEYLMASGERKRITKIASDEFTVDTYRPDGTRQEHRIYQTFGYPMMMLNDGARSDGWFDLLDEAFSEPTGVYELYDNDGQMVEYGDPDQGITHLDLNQKVSYRVTKTDDLELTTYYVINTEYLYSGTYREDLGYGLVAVYTIKNGLRHGTAKIIDTSTNKTIQKVKYDKGLLK